MNSRQVIFSSDTVRDFMANPRRGAEYSATIDNNTDQSITITVSNQNPNQGETPTFSNPAAGVLTIASGANGSLIQPYATWRITAAGAASGTVDIIEAG